MSYYEQPPYEQPPYEQPPYGASPYERPPYEERPPYDRPRYEGPPYERPPYDQGPPPSDSPYGCPPGVSAPPPPMPPPPLPLGWTQHWEPSLRRAFFFEEPTGRSQWEPPMGDSEFGSRSGPPPESDSYYRPGPEGYGAPPQGEGYEDPEQKKKSDWKKYALGGAAGLALGAAGGALITHEMGEESSGEEEEEDEQEREPEEYEYEPEEE